MADSNRLKALQNLASNMPTANKKIAAGQKAAGDIALQQAVGQAPTGVAGVRQAQGLGAQMATALGQQQVAGQQQLQQQQGAAAQQILGQQQVAQRQQLGQGQLAQQREQLSSADRIYRLDRNLGNDLFGRQIQFDKDQAGRALMNERQLADYAIASAKSSEDFKNYAQTAQQASERKLTMMEMAYKKLSQALEQDSLETRSDIGKDTKRELFQMKVDMENRIASEKRDIAIKNSMWTAGGTVVGAVVGGYFGGPTGAAGGAAAGGAAGSGMAASTT